MKAGLMPWDCTDGGAKGGKPSTEAATNFGTPWDTSWACWKAGTGVPVLAYRVPH